MKKLLLAFLLPLSLSAATYAPAPVVSNFSSLTNRSGSAVNPVALVLGGTTYNDGAGGHFFFDGSNTNAVDGDNFLPATPSGRWVRISRQTKASVSPLQQSNGTNSLLSLTNWYTFAANSPLSVSQTASSATFSLSLLTNWFSFLAGTNMQVTVTSNSVTYAMTNTTFSGGGGSTNNNSVILVSGNPVTNANFVTDLIGPYLRLYQNDTTNVYYTIEWEGVVDYLATNVLVAGSNVTLTYNDAAGTITIASTGGGGSTNGTPVYVDSAGPLAAANFINSSEIDPAASGTNVTLSIIANSLATNKIDSTFYSLLTTRDAGTNAFVNGVLVQPLRLTNSTSLLFSSDGSGNIIGTVNDYDGFWTDLTNAVVAGTNIVLTYNGGTQKMTINSTATGGGGGGSGTNVFVNGTLIQPAYFTNSSTVLVSTNSNGHITLTATNQPGTITSNVLQWVGSAYFVITNNSTLGDFKTLVTNGVISTVTCVDCQNDSPAIIEFTFPSRATNYVWTFMPEGNVNGYVAYEAEGYRTATALRVKMHEAVGSTFYTGGYWMRFDLWDKASVGGNGSGSTLYVTNTSTSSANLTSNWFVRPVLSGTNITFIPTPAVSSSTASFTPDLSQSRIFNVTLTNNLTLNIPTNVSAEHVDQKFEITFIQDSTGSRLLSTIATNYLFGRTLTGLTLTTNGGYRDSAVFRIRSSSPVLVDVQAFSDGYTK